jgi:uncharacterized protein YndB with AHSA1/START domain
MTETIDVDQFLPKPPSAVWRMLTEPDRLATWFVAGDIRPEVGHRFTLDMPGWGPQACTVTAVEPERLLSHTFGEGTTDWTLTWRLVGEGVGTRLFLTHGGFDPADPGQQKAYTNMSRGWAGTVLPRLVRTLEEVPAS